MVSFKWNKMLCQLYWFVGEISKVFVDFVCSNWSGGGSWSFEGSSSGNCQCNRRRWWLGCKQTKPWPTTKACQKRNNTAATADDSTQFLYEIIRSLRWPRQIQWEHSSISDLQSLDAEPTSIQSDYQVSFIQQNRIQRNLAEVIAKWTQILKSTVRKTHFNEYKSQIQPFFLSLAINRKKKFRQ